MDFTGKSNEEILKLFLDFVLAMSSEEGLKQIDYDRKYVDCLAGYKSSLESLHKIAVEIRNHLDNN